MNRPAREHFEHANDLGAWCQALDERVSQLEQRQTALLAAWLRQQAKRPRNNKAPEIN